MFNGNVRVDTQLFQFVLRRLFRDSIVWAYIRNFGTNYEKRRKRNGGLQKNGHFFKKQAKFFWTKIMKDGSFMIP